MRAFTQMQGVAATIAGKNVDTDQIIPARYLKRSRTDPQYADYLFHDLRFNDRDEADPAFVLNQSACREAAVYALEAFGIRAIIAPSFGDIFFNNCLKNGLLPIRLQQIDIDLLSGAGTVRARDTLESFNPLSIKIDLEACSLQSDLNHTTIRFSIDPFWQECLMKGLDELDLTLSYQSSIDAFETTHLANSPWLTHAHK